VRNVKRKHQERCMPSMKPPLLLATFTARLFYHCSTDTLACKAMASSESPSPGSWSLGSGGGTKAWSPHWPLAFAITIRRFRSDHGKDGSIAVMLFKTASAAAPPRDDDDEEDDVEGASSLPTSHRSQLPPCCRPLVKRHLVQQYLPTTD